MRDPYKVLEVSPNASDEDVKKAYRELARKYHPDNYHDNPLADLAQEKMKEVNEAYNTILRQRGGGHGGNAGGRAYYGGGWGGSRRGGHGSYGQIRMAISRGDLRLAEELLNAASERDAEWHFLMGGLFYRKGWLDEARQYFQKAAAMDPGNREYQQALAQMQAGGFAYRGHHHGGGLSACDCCTALMCLNCLCR